MIIDHTLKIVLLHVPKCAGTSLRQAFLEDGRERDVVSFFDFEYRFVFEVVHVCWVFNVKPVSAAVSAVDVATYIRQRGGVDNIDGHFVWVGKNVHDFVVDC